MGDIVSTPDPSRRDSARRARAEQLAAARELAKACMTQLDELEAAAKTWRVRPDHAEGIYLRNYLTTFRTLTSMILALPPLIEGFEESGEHLLREVRNEAAKMYESILIFRRFIGTLQGDYERGNLLGADRAVNQAVSTLVSHLNDAIRKLTQPPPRREFKIQRSWVISASTVAGLIALYFVSSMVTGQNADARHILDYGLARCVHNRAIGKLNRIYCPLGDFSVGKWPMSVSLVHTIEENIKGKPEFNGMRF
jgi:hypothetical protein